MKNSTESKHYTELATATKKSSRWLRTSSHRGEIEQLFDLYWGGKERRITGLTLRIIGVNVIALLCLVVGVIYLGQYHATLIETKLERFETEIMLVTAAISEGAFDNQSLELSTNKAKVLSARLGATINKRILVFDFNGDMIADSKILIEKNGVEPILKILKEKKRKLDSVKMLKDMAGWIASFFPQHGELPLFEGVKSQKANDYYDVVDAKNKKLSISAWQDENSQIILTAAMPILSQSKIIGIVMLVGDGQDIKNALGEAWFNILKIFLVTLLITILLSIYLSGVIARPLRKLAVAAENVRKGKLKHTEIPDMGDRNDEIGELSIVLRDMTHALWERMDTIEAFAADVAHEIKNPLTSLKSAVETAAIVTNKKDLNKLLDVIKHDVDRLDRLITDISKASRLDAELSRETFDVVDITQVLYQLLDALKSPLERKVKANKNSNQAIKDGIKIILDLPDGADIYVMGSETRLTQVFQNIISNALSFAPDETKIRVIMEAEEGRVIITIEDEGRGIPENQLKNIFERFYSERPQHEEYGRHSGLGLSICKQIITAHNGIIYAENIQNEAGETIGARFVIVLNQA